jgi:hypothetical protein
MKPTLNQTQTIENENTDLIVHPSGVRGLYLCMKEIHQLRYVFLSLVLYFSSFFLSGVEFTPIVKQFTKKEYNASNQNWSIGQDRDGVMYFGNNQGLLEFDGSLWQIHKMPGNKIVRSVLVQDNRIYVGSFEEFGYFVKDEKGLLNYTSLSSKLKKYNMQNDEVWTILNITETLFFNHLLHILSIKTKL